MLLDNGFTQLQRVDPVRPAFHLLPDFSYPRFAIALLRCFLGSLSLRRQRAMNHKYIVNHVMRPLLLVLAAISSFAAPAAAHKTQNIIFVMTDGFRWQELFRGADVSLMTKENGVKDEAAYKHLYWREKLEDRREALMPFVWTVIAKTGQLYGNRDNHSDAFVTNGLNFSYPGYNEALCGFPDPRIKSNDKIPNPNQTVLEWLNKRPEYHGNIAAFGAWDVFTAIFNGSRAGFLVNAGYDPLILASPSPRIDLLNALKAELPHVWQDEPFDALPYESAMEYLRLAKPRILYLSLGETDDWAHEGNYAEYLNAAHRADAFVKDLWEMMQAMPEYHGTTTLIFATDHGRGDAPSGWKSHGEKVPESKYVWMAFLGPDTPALGERTNIAPVTQSQIASTLAALLGTDYPAAVPAAGQPILDVLPH